MTCWLKLALTGMAGTQMSFDVFLDHAGACETRASGKIYFTVDRTWWGLLIPTVSPVEYNTWSPCHVHNGYYKQHRYFTVPSEKIRQIG